MTQTQKTKRCKNHITQKVKLKNSGSALMIFFVKCKTAVRDSAVSLIKYSREKCGTDLTVFPPNKRPRCLFNFEALRCGTYLMAAVKGGFAYFKVKELF